MTTDRRRVNGPKGGTNPPVFAPTSVGKTFDAYPRRTRPPNALRNICRYSMDSVPMRNRTMRVYRDRLTFSACYSPQNRPHPLCLRLRLPRAPIPQQQCHSHASSAISTQTYLLSPWTSSASALCALYTTPPSLHTREIRAFCMQITERLRTGLQ